MRDVREHGVEVRAPDVNFSDWNSTLEPGPRAAEPLHELHMDMRGDIRTTHAMRLGLREIKGISEEDAALIAEKRGVGYNSVRDVWLRTGLHPRVLERLADADAFSSLGLTRRDALWAAKALGRVGDRDDDLPLFATDAPAIQRLVAREPDVALPPMPLGEEVVNDYRFLHLSLRAHPAQFLRGELNRRGVLRNETLRTVAQRHTRQDRRPRHLPAAAGLGQWRRVHDDRGRDGGGQRASFGQKCSSACGPSCWAPASSSITGAVQSESRRHPRCRRRT